ncbi:MAG: peptide-methionine (S)-S-oxide reductase MsrA [Bryobacteraceae bacterium]|jgi:peptide-methionine (S)-S-oxide reductase
MATEETVTLGGGCFWCVEAVYQQMEGVLAVESGYMGGRLANPAYQQVCSGTTGHVEVVQVKFDSEISSFSDILEVFFATHDPTSFDRQGDDAGTQYRSVIFYHGDVQRHAAEQAIRELNAERIWPAPIVTEVRAAETFYPAEDYHRDYFRSHPGQPYCAAVVAPKVRKFREKFSAKLRREA